MTFKTIKIAKRGGGHRMQKVQVLASGKYKFVKNGGASATKHHTEKKTVAKSKSKSRKRSRKSTAMVHVRHRSPTHQRRSRRRRGHGFGSVPVVPVAIGAAALAYLTGKSGPQVVQENVAKIPGVKTFGPLAMTGLVCLGIDRFVKPNKYLKIAGIVGVAAAAMKVGEAGKDFKWLGDADDIGDYDDDIGDIGDADDIGDDEE